MFLINNDLQGSYLYLSKNISKENPAKTWYRACTGKQEKSNGNPLSELPLC